MEERSYIQTLYNHIKTFTINDDQHNNVSNILVFYVNGIEVRENKVEPEWTLLFYLRNKLNLYGTKLGCAEGGCGACTVTISKYDRKKDKITHLAVNACLMPLCAMHGLSVTTIEGLGSTRFKLHPIQERIAKSHGSQCGFCTPGIIMSMYSLLRTKPFPSIEDIEVAFQGNLCRCTGYRPIIEACCTFTEDWEKSIILKERHIKNGDKCCTTGSLCCKRILTVETTGLFDTSSFLPYKPTQEPIFPPQLQVSSELDNEYLILKGRDVTWYRPVHLYDLLLLKQKYPNSKIIVGNTEIGVEIKFKSFVYPVLIQPTKIDQLREISDINDGIRIGASVTFDEMEEALQHQLKTKPEEKTRIFKAIVDMLNGFAGKQIRNVAAIGGNIMTSSPISDLNPILMAAEIKLNICSMARGFRSIIMDSKFFVSYRRNIILPDEVLISIEIPYSLPNEYFESFKQAKRRDDDIAIVNFALNIFFKPTTNIVEKVLIVFGGMAPTTILSTKTCSEMIGKKWDRYLLEETIDSLILELPLSNDAPGGMVLYRRTLTISFFFKAFVRITKKLRYCISDVDLLPPELESAGDYFHFQRPQSSQYFQMISPDQLPLDLIGRPIVHISAYKQATGEAKYCDDIPRIADELYLALILSTKAHAKIISIDYSQALLIDGVKGFIDANDIPADRRLIGHKVFDEEIFVSQKVTSQGQILGAIIASNQVTAQKAVKLVKVEYEDLNPIIITIEDAIKAHSFLSKVPTVVSNGDVNNIFKEANNVIEGQVRIGGQEHFYLETQTSLAVYREEGELDLYTSSQNPTALQKLTAQVLGLSINRINVCVKRLGGGFGGKETREALVALPVALAAYKFRKPVRCMLDRDEDMMITGTRHPFLIKYKVSFTDEGKITAAEVDLFSNCGYSTDLSPAVLECAMLYFANGYNIPVVKVSGYMCKTNLPSNTAFRGFGGPQGMFCAENMIRHIADYLGSDPIKITEINLYREGDTTFYQQQLTSYTLRECWNECIRTSNYSERKGAVIEFNRNNRYRKKGISVVPVMFGIGYEVTFLNQAGALVHIYTDGSVLLNHGGVEMGQGLYTKMLQVASRILKVNPEKIYTTETCTNKVPNTIATAASLGSDLNGMAVLDACSTIMNRIKYIIDENPNGTWEEWIKRAYFDRVSLSATGYYRTPDIGYDLQSNSGKRFNYYTYGAACSEVEVDCLTGDHEVKRTDIVMDLGESLNPAIDIGQIEGGYMQGYGLFTMEEMIYSPTGTVYSRGPGTYKIPSFTNIPREFYVSLLKGSSNISAVFSSKAVGEPPLFLASSVFFAIKEAIKAAREDMGINGFFRLDSPATVARIRMACVDSLVKKVGNGDGKDSWNVVP